MKLIHDAPDYARVEVKLEKRSLAQNAKMWSMLSDVATQLPWHGQKLRPNDWKLIFLDALKRETRIVPNLDNDGFVMLSQSSSDLSIDEMSDLIELITAFAEDHHIQLHDGGAPDAAA
jgi:hypothetical protein